MVNQELRCPLCENPVNRMWFWDIVAGSAFFVCECWSGDIQKEKPRHYFNVGFSLPETIYYDLRASDNGKLEQILREPISKITQRTTEIVMKRQKQQMEFEMEIGK